MFQLRQGRSLCKGMLFGCLTKKDEKKSNVHIPLRFQLICVKPFVLLFKSYSFFLCGLGECFLGVF